MDDPSLPGRIWQAFWVLAALAVGVGFLYGIGAITGGGLLLGVLAALLAFVPWAVFQLDVSSFGEQDGRQAHLVKGQKEQQLDPLDEKLMRAWLLAAEDVTDANEAELNALVPVLIEAGYIEEKPWGDDPEFFLWSFTEAGSKRSEELEAMHGPAGDP